MVCIWVFPPIKIQSGRKSERSKVFVLEASWGGDSRETGDTSDGKCALMKEWVLEQCMTETPHGQFCYCISHGDSIKKIKYLKNQSHFTFFSI